jgi:formylglycine-generating enzyme required for sulfatase activity
MTIKNFIILFFSVGLLAQTALAEDVEFCVGKRVTRKNCFRVDKEVIKKFPESILGIALSDGLAGETLNPLEKNGPAYFPLNKNVHPKVFEEILYWMETSDASIIQGKIKKKEFSLNTIRIQSQFLLLPELYEQIACPRNYVFVPGNPLYKTPNAGNDFCVMKYPASNHDEKGVAKSRMRNLPWTSINRDEAANACAQNGWRYHLMTNSEWMTIARNIEGNPKNWSAGKVGEGFLSRGNSDKPNPNKASSPSQDNDPYFDTGFNDWTHKRTHLLSNDQMIWDMAGNVWQWVSDTLVTGNYGKQGYTSDYFNPQRAKELRLIFAPNGLYGRAQNTGIIDMSNQEAVIRGGSYLDKNHSGIFAAKTSAASTQSYINLGFRCAYSLSE